MNTIENTLAGQALTIAQRMSGSERERAIQSILSSLLDKGHIQEAAVIHQQAAYTTPPDDRSGFDSGVRDISEKLAQAQLATGDTQGAIATLATQKSKMWRDDTLIKLARHALSVQPDTTQAAETARTIVAAITDSYDRRQANLFIATFLVQPGDCSAVLEYIGGLDTDIARDGAREEASAQLVSRDLVDEAIAIIDDITDPKIQVGALYQAAYAQLDKGRTADAERIAKRLPPDEQKERLLAAFPTALPDESAPAAAPAEQTAPRELPDGEQGGLSYGDLLEAGMHKDALTILDAMSKQQAPNAHLLQEIIEAIDDPLAAPMPIGEIDLPKLMEKANRGQGPVLH